MRWLLFQARQTAEFESLSRKQAEDQLAIGALTAKADEFQANTSVASTSAATSDGGEGSEQPQGLGEGEHVRTLRELVDSLKEQLDLHRSSSHAAKSQVLELKALLSKAEASLEEEGSKAGAQASKAAEAMAKVERLEQSMAALEEEREESNVAREAMEAALKATAKFRIAELENTVRRGEG